MYYLPFNPDIVLNLYISKMISIYQDLPVENSDGVRIGEEHLEHETEEQNEVRNGESLLASRH